MRIKRRKFLGQLAAGSAVVSMPAFLSGCGVNRAVAVAEPTPANPFLEWFAVDQAVIARVMAELTKNGADAADLYFQHRRTNELRMEHSIVSGGDSDILQGVGLRVVIGEQAGYAFTAELTAESMLAAAQTAAAVASGNVAVPPQAFSLSDPGDLYRVELPWADVAAASKLRILQRVDVEARRADPTVHNVSVAWADVDERIMIATLDGRLILDHRPLTRLSAQVTATRGDNVQSGFASISARQELSWYTDERVDGMVREAVDRTLVQFDARRAPTGDMPVVLSAGASGILLHEAIGHGMEADFNRSGSSAYSGMLGQKVAEPFVTIVDQGTLPNARGALNYDDEGQACGRNVLVEGGRLRSYLHDGISARQFAVPATGSGRRESYRFQPLPRMTCTFMEDGPHTREEIIAAVDFGVVADTYTRGDVQIGAGDYTFSVGNGWLVEQGRITAALKDFNISGNGPDTLRNVSMVANDARFDSGGWTCGKKGQRVPVSQGMPTVLVAKLGVRGEDA